MKLTDSVIDQTLKRDNRWKKKNQTDSTHLFLDDKGIDEIESLSSWTSVTFVYLRKNKLLSTRGIELFKNVTHLYLEKNQIAKMTSFGELHELRKLYLGYNFISVVEGLENCSSLELLHIQNQTLPPGGMMYFDPRCANGLQVSLKDLNVAGNNLIALTDFSGLDKLEKLDATDNKLENLSQIRDDLSELRRLKTIDLRGNPITKMNRYREKIVAVLSCVGTLDGKAVSELNRVFIQNLEKCRKVERKSAIEFSKDIRSLAEHLPLGIRNSITDQEAIKGIASRINVMLPNTPPVRNDLMQDFPRRKMLKKQTSSQTKDSPSKLSSKSKSSEDEIKIEPA